MCVCVAEHVQQRKNYCTESTPCVRVRRQDVSIRPRKVSGEEGRQCESTGVQESSNGERKP